MYSQEAAEKGASENNKSSVLIMQNLIPSVVNYDD